VALKAVTLVTHFFLVTFRAVIHLHTIPGILFDAPGILAPDITAVAGNSIFFIGS
jgi:hypothetical protein